MKKQDGICRSDDGWEPDSGNEENKKWRELIMDIESTGPAEQVTVDVEKNRIYLYFRGSLSLAQAEALHDAYREAIAKVGRSFTAVSIFEDFIPGTPEVQEVIARMIRMANSNGCRSAARVSQSSVFGQLQLGRLQREVKADYPVKDCQTLAEADLYLDGLAAE